MKDVDVRFGDSSTNLEWLKIQLEEFQEKYATAEHIMKRSKNDMAYWENAISATKSQIAFVEKVGGK